MSGLQRLSVASFAHNSGVSHCNTWRPFTGKVSSNGAQNSQRLGWKSFFDSATVCCVHSAASTIYGPSKNARNGPQGWRILHG